MINVCVVDRVKKYGLDKGLRILEKVPWALYWNTSTSTKVLIWNQKLIFFPTVYSYFLVTLKRITYIFDWKWISQIKMLRRQNWNFNNHLNANDEYILYFSTLNCLLFVKIILQVKFQRYILKTNNWIKPVNMAFQVQVDQFVQYRHSNIIS